MYRDIILIGPMGVGKTTTSLLISQRLKLQAITLDDIIMYYYYKQGYNVSEANQLIKEVGPEEMYNNIKPMDAMAVLSMLEDFNNCVFDLGAGHSVYEDDRLFKKVKLGLASYENVVLLMPAKDHDESLAFLLNRAKSLGMSPNDGQIKLLKHFIEHPSNWDLAKHVVYIKDKSPDAICEDVLNITGMSDNLTSA